MKRMSRIPGLKLWTMLLLFGASLGSCNVLTEEEQDCAVYVRFKYDMNMEFADAFQNAVNSVTLYAFDKDGVLAYQKTEEGDLLKQDGYRMRLDGISHSDKAEYDFITWAGEPDNESFIIPLLTVGKSTKEDLYCQLKRAEGGIVNDDLEALFHGQANDLNFGRAATSKMDEVVVPLVKNTNNVRIVLQHLDGRPVEVENFDFTITDENGLMSYDNSLMEDEVLTYQAWRTDDGYAGLDEDQVEKVEGVTGINVAIAELTTARLMKTERPILTITNKETGDKVLSIPLVDYALLVKGYYNREMDDQEYLDRQDEYALTFFLDDGNRWINSSIIINSWRVVLQNSDLK